MRGLHFDIQLLRLPLYIRLAVKRDPWLYRAGKFLTDSRAKNLICNKQTDICIEGYQSSGNSFSFALLQNANKSLRIAHHCHSVANLRLALNYNVPAVCLIRDPENAISSRLARFGGSIDDAVREYVDFYEFALKDRDRLIIVTFDELTRNTREFLARISCEADLNLSFENFEDLNDDVVRRIKEWNLKHGVPEKLSLPLESRQKMKKNIQKELEKCLYYSHARAIWCEITNKNDHGF